VINPISSSGSRWSSEDAIFVRQIMEDLADEGVNEITCICSAQSAKTLTMLASLAWIIAEDPGPILWVTSNVQEAKKFAKSRLLPLLERCAPVAAKLPVGRSHKMTCELYFPGAPLIICGAESEASLQSTPFRYVFLDEARSYPPGAIEMVSQRFASYTHNWKKFIFTTPAKEGDAVHQSFLAGDQRHWLVPCPECAHEHEMEWGDDTTKGGLHWDKSPDTYDEERGQYRFDALQETIRYDCWNPECTHRWTDTPEDRKYISSHGRWVARNTNAPSNSRSYTWSALLPWWRGWRTQVRQFILANKALEWTDYVPLQSHMNETRGQVWTDKLKFANDEKYFGKRKASYKSLEKWEHEVRRFMSVDVQGKGGRHFYYVIRAWGLMGRSRLISHGIAYSWEELAQVALTHTVSPDNVVIDSGAWAPEVYKAVVSSGYRWKAFKADDKDSFRSDGLAWLYSKTAADPAIGTNQQGKVRPIDLYMWAKYGVRDRLYAFLHGTIGDWQVFDDVAEEYILQVCTWDQRTRQNRYGTEYQEWYQKRPDDHYCDCEQMQVVAASIMGLLTMPEELPLFQSEAAESHTGEESYDESDHSPRQAEDAFEDA